MRVTACLEQNNEDEITGAQLYTPPIFLHSDSIIWEVR